MASDQSDEETEKKLYLEDVLILILILLLFWLGGLIQDQTWAQLAFGGVLVAMLLIFIRRIRRTYRSFEDRDE